MAKGALPASKPVKDAIGKPRGSSKGRSKITTKAEKAKPLSKKLTTSALSKKVGGKKTSLPMKNAPGNQLKLQKDQCG